MKTRLNRRQFLACSSALAAAGATRAWGFPAITAVRSPNGLCRHACVGAGNMAWGDINSFRSHPKIEMAAFCDVDANYLARAKKEFPKARFYVDWREMLEKEGDAIDSANVSIPDHHHVGVAAAFMRKGRHVYVQKPLCKTIRESEFLRNLAQKTGVVTQLGAQFNATLSDRHTVELLKTQALGPVEHVYYFSTRKGLSRRRRELPVAAPVPGTLNWDLWLGTAAVRPYAPKVYHPLIWRIWRDLGSGWIGDIGCHLMSAVWRGMELNDLAPIDVFAETQTDADPAVKDLVWPTAAHIVWHMPGVKASDGKPFTMEWFDGCSDADLLAPAQFRPPAEIDASFAQTPAKQRPYEGKAIKCRDGWILQPHASAAAFIRRNDGAPMKAPKLPKCPSHFHEFIDSCLEGRKAAADFGWATHMMDTILVGQIAERLPGAKLTWNAQKRAFGNAAADAFLTRPYRAGWEVPGLA